MFLYLTIIYIDIMKRFFLFKELSLLIGEDPTVKISYVVLKTLFFCDIYILYVFAPRIEVLK